MSRLIVIVPALLIVGTYLYACEQPEPEKKPNLVISQATLDPPKFKEGDKVTLTCTIKNVGDEKAEPRPAMSVGTSDQGIVHVAPGAPGTSVEPGATSLCRTYVWYPYNCNTEIRIHVDPGDDIAESNELDNTWAKTLDHSICQEDPAKTAFYKDCVDRVNKLRQLEGLTQLVHDQTKQACSNDDARVNFEMNDPHAQECGPAQNTCPLLASTQKILDECIEKQMYYQEKQNYIKNPNVCYDAAWPNTCGHYVNMTDKFNAGYTKVACGIHRAPSGEFLAVINFFK